MKVPFWCVQFLVCSLLLQRNLLLLLIYLMSWDMGTSNGGMDFASFSLSRSGYEWAWEAFQALIFHIGALTRALHVNIFSRLILIIIAIMAHCKHEVDMSTFIAPCRHTLYDSMLAKDVFVCNEYQRSTPTVRACNQCTVGLFIYLKDSFLRRRYHFAMLRKTEACCSLEKAHGVSIQNIGGNYVTQVPNILLFLLRDLLPLKKCNVMPVLQLRECCYRWVSQCALMFRTILQPRY